MTEEADFGRSRGELPAGEFRHLLQQQFIRAVLVHLVFLPVEAHLGEGARIHQGPHAEESLILADGEAAAVVPRRHLGHILSPHALQ